jgi:hypothetical protein
VTKSKSKLKTRREFKIIYPAAVDIRMRPVGKRSRNYDLWYWEGFYKTRVNEVVVERTLLAMQSLFFGTTKLEINREDRDGFLGLSVKGTLPRGMIGDMLVSEFMGWSNVAETLTLKKMIEGSVHGLIATSSARPPPPMPMFDSKQAAITQAELDSAYAAMKGS